jgi:hypothetical protein
MAQAIRQWGHRVGFLYNYPLSEPTSAAVVNLRLVNLMLGLGPGPTNVSVLANVDTRLTNMVASSKTQDMKKLSLREKCISWEKSTAISQTAQLASHPPL